MIKYLTFLIIILFILISCKTKENSTDKIVSKNNSKSIDSLKIEKEISLGNVKGRIDHLEIDDSSKILYVAALGNNSIEIVDLKLKSVVSSIKGIEEPQSIIFIKEKNLFCVSSGGSGECKFYDAKNYSLVKSVKIGSDADNMRYDKEKKIVYAGYGEGAIAIIDIENLFFINSVKLPGHPESFQIDKSKNRIYVNVPDSKSIEVIDLEKNSVIDSWVLKDAASNFPIALDEKDNLLFIGCRNPAILIVYDILTGKEINRFEIKGDIDEIFFDGNMNLIYLTCGSGYLMVFKKDSKESYNLKTEMETSKGARTGLLDNENRYIYLAVPQNEKSGAKINLYIIK